MRRLKRGTLNDMLFFLFFFNIFKDLFNSKQHHNTLKVFDSNKIGLLLNKPTEFNHHVVTDCYILN